MAVVRNSAIMVNDCAGIDDDVVSDLRAWLDNRTRHDLGALPDHHIELRYNCCRVLKHRKGKPFHLALLEKLLARLLARRRSQPIGQKRCSRIERRKPVVAADDLNAEHGFAMQRRARIDEAENVKIRRQCRRRNDLAVAAGP